MHANLNCIQNSENARKKRKTVKTLLWIEFLFIISCTKISSHKSWIIGNCSSNKILSANIGKCLHSKGFAMSLSSNQPLDHQKSYYIYYLCICSDHFVQCKHFDCIMHIFVPHQQFNYNTHSSKAGMLGNTHVVFVQWRFKQIFVFVNLLNALFWNYISSF